MVLWIYLREKIHIKNGVQQGIALSMHFYLLLHIMYLNKPWVLVKGRKAADDKNNLVLHRQWFSKEF